MGVIYVNTLFAETLRKLRTERGLSQKQLGKQLFVYHSTIARWESGIRLPDAAMIPRLAKCLGVDANTLFHLAADSDEIPNVIMVDDNEVVLSHGLTVLGEVMPNAAVTGFTGSVEAIEYAKMNRVALAVLDIELGTASGLDLCRRLLEINSCSLMPARHKVHARANNLELLRLCKDYQVPVILASDAHINYDIANYEHVLPLLEETHFPESLIMNDKPDWFFDYLQIPRCV